MKKNIIFDVGEVLLSYRWQDAVKDGGFTDEDSNAVIESLFKDPIWHEGFDRGTVNENELLSHYIKTNPCYEDLYRWFFSHPELLPVRRDRVYEYLPRLREKGYRLYILSDYSEFLSEIHFSFGGFRKYFDGEIISYRVHAVKPEPEIYRCLLDTYMLNPGECIFLDDKEANIAGANACGINGIVITSEDKLIEVLESFLV